MFPAAKRTPGNKDSVSVVGDHDGKSVRDLVTENAVVIFSRKGCCLCHVVKLLLQGHGVNPTILGLDEQDEADVTQQMTAFVDGKERAPPDFPAVFVGGELFGGMDEIMRAHMSSELVPRLRAAGALWL